MNPPVASAGDAGRRFAALARAWPAVCAIFVLAAAALFVYDGVRYADETQRELRLIPDLRYDLREDFGYFYAGAEMVWRGDASDLYPEPGELTYYPRDPIFFQPVDEYASARLLARGNYYNPPALAYLQAPLSTLSFRAAFWLFSLGGLACLGGFLALAWWSGRRVPELPLLLAGVLAFKPVHEALMLGHVTLYLMLALTAGFLLLRAERRVLAGLAFALLAFKPQWAVLPGLFLLIRGEWRSLGTMAVAAAAIFFLPFIATGFHTLGNYVEFLRFSARVDLKDAPHMFSWNGFLSKLDDSEVLPNGEILLFADAPPQALVYGLILLTALLLVAVWWSRDYLLGVAATVVAMLLVSTHSVWYDWALLGVAALFLVLRSPSMPRNRRVEMWLVLLALFVASSQSISEVLAPDRHDVDWHRAAFYAITPVAFGSLLWMVALAFREGRMVWPRLGLRLR